ncbi:alpha/beta fold hydrolase [Naumannella sp. ID2617S]|nr:alpha/beta fold hydrolase [Naumannella sp. ID2617S]
MGSRIAATVAGALAAVLLGCSQPGPVRDPSLFGTPQPSAGATVASTPVPPASAFPTPTATPSPVSPDRPRLPIPAVEVPGLVDPPPGSGPERYQQQPVDWRRCTLGQREFACARVLAPLDADRPDERAVTLQLVKVPATREPRLGTIFVNPGGPGEGGTTLATNFRRKGLEQFDIVGWDPRGTGRSTPVRCADPAATDAYLAADGSPDDEAERAAYRQQNLDFTRACLDGSGQLLQHVSTIDTVRDLDLLRGLVGEQKLNYFGYSYGTAIGSRYAQLYPDRVGAMGLDGAVNVTDDQSVVQAMGFDRALTAFADWCAADGCSLGRDRAAVLRSVTELFDRADAAPIPTNTARPLTQSKAVTGVISLLYRNRSGWPDLLAAVERARAGDGTTLLALADAYDGRSRTGAYQGRVYAFGAVRCLDRADQGFAGADARAAREAEQAPVLGRYLGPDYLCPSWPVPPRPPAGLVAAPGVTGILVIGTTGDSATPYEYAPRMARELGSARLLTYVAEGHAAYGGKSQCVDDAVVRLFTSGPPAEDLTC